MTSDPADLGVVEAARLLHDRTLSATELTRACLARIGSRDGQHTADGDPGSINAWIRVYDEDAIAAAARADQRLSAASVAASGPAPALCGVPIGLKDIYAAAGKPVTASSRLLHDIADRDCDAWARLQAAGVVLLGHLHTHEFAAGASTDQVGNPWALDRSVGGSSGGSAAALSSRMVPATTGTDTAGSLRIPSALCGTSAIKPTRGLVSIAGVIPLAPTLDHCGPMARTVADCAALLAAMIGSDAGDATSAFAQLSDIGDPPSDRPGQTLDGLRLAVSPQVGGMRLDDDVSDGLTRALRAGEELGAILVEPRTTLPAPAFGNDQSFSLFSLLGTEMRAFHRRYDDQRDRYRPSTRQLLEAGESVSLTGPDYVTLQTNRQATTRMWSSWLADEGIDALLEPTVPIVAPTRGNGYDQLGSDAELIAFTGLWNWTGFPVVSLPAGVGRRSGLPVGVSLVGPAGTDRRLLEVGAVLQSVLGIPVPDHATR